jgi:peptide/nickel transport system permease protein
VLSPVFVAATLGIGNIVVVEAGLSYLGLGIPQPRASWGNIIRDGRDVMSTAWWVSVFPGFALSATVLAVNVVAERLRQALNPRQLPAP